MAKKNETTTKFKVDVSELVKGMQTAKRQIALANAEFKSATAGMDNWSKSADGVSAKLTQLDKNLASQKTILGNLEDQYELTVAQMGEGSKEAENLRIKIENQKASIANTEKQIRTYNQSLNDITAEANQSSTALDTLTQQIKDQESELDDLKQTYANAVLEFGKGSDEAQELANKIDALSSDLNDNKKAMSDATTSADKLDNSLRDVDDSADKASDGFTIMKGAISNLIADGFQKLASIAMDSLGTVVTETDKAYNNFQANTGTSTEAMGEFEDQINEIYKNNYGESLGDISDAMAEIAQQTKETDPTKLKDLTENAIALRDTFDMDIQESMRAVNMLMEQFGIDGEDAFNLIVQGAQKGLNKNGDLLDSINEYSVHYKQLGYTSDEFFNSLLNGTESGTFSVDKLGDAMKEFGIRTKDTADSTTEGFELIGYGVEATTEDIADQRDKVAELEKKLGYAKKEQAGFNEKTSELKKQKMADTIKEYEFNLGLASDKLTAMEKSTDGNVTSVDDMREAFAKGGTTAKKATKEVLKKLFEMDDKVKQNQAGVDLFGTMWEDLGAEGVKALMETEGGLKANKKAMEDVKKVKYADIASQFAQVGRTIQMEVLAPLAEKVLPVVKEFADYCINNMPEVERTIKAVGVVLVTAFAVNKIAGFISSVSTMVTTFKGLKTAIDASATAQKIFMALQATNPWGLLAVAVGGVVTAMLLLSDTSDTIKEKYSQLSESEKANKDAVDKLAQSYADVTKARDDSVADAQAQFTYYDQLSEELDGLVDANGKVKKGYEDRAEFIVTTLNEALGSELQMTDGIITNYEDQKKALDELMETKRAQIILNANEQAYTDAINNQTEAFNNLSTAQANVKTTTEDIKTAQKEYDAIKEMSLDTWAEERGLIGLSAHEISDSYNTALDNAKGKVEGLKSKQDEQNNTLSEAEDLWINYNSTIKNYEGLSSAIISGDTDKINVALDDLVNGFITAEQGNKRSLESQVTDMKKNYENLKKAVEDGAPGVTKEMVNTSKEMVDKSVDELNKFESDANTAGSDGSMAFADGMMSNDLYLISKGVLLGNNAVKGLKTASTRTAGSDKAKEFGDGLNGDSRKTQAEGKELGNTAVKGLDQVKTFNSGTNFAVGFGNGITSESNKRGGGSIWAKVTNFGKSALDWLNKSLDEHSPSKLTAKSGRFFTEGFANGIIDQIPEVKKAVSSLAKEALKGLDSDAMKIPVNANILSDVSNRVVGGGLGGASGQVINNNYKYEYNQTNNSPKALSRLEIYRQTKNLTSYAVGGGN